ncbi:protein LSM14 homolog car-1 isoform X3 [Procambarus clarkii]|uniref:protein LSM14 homolog car-1 isoform X3 n=1 Tax=Procambarus clarkii TaxID=6728 RepID=UPI001E6750D2|nr:protein LSM14 homolog A-like isoform X6 [Procambarus clarkii]
MSGPIPFLGSKISLISKSEIRYEGILYTIDAQESIIALAKVRSFGTEDRPTEMPVPARDEVYEYIIFRGTDIKKIEVCDTPKQPTLLHNDPAIVQHSAPAVPSSFQAAPFSRQSLGPIGGGLGLSYSAYGQSMTQQGIPGGGGFQMGATTQPNILVASRSSTPTVRKSPVSDAGVQVTPPPTREEKKKSQSQPQPQRQQESRPQRTGSQGGQSRRSNQQQTQQQMAEQIQQQNQQQPQQNQQQQYHNNQYYQYQQQYKGRGGMNRGRGSRRPSGQRGRGQIFNQGNRQRQFQDRQLFETEFDFEQANEEFEEVRNQLAKTKITENGDKKEDSGHETAGTDDDVQSTCYDKTKSFFDSISCESIERSQGNSQRPDWRHERKINVETFGVSSARRGYYPRGRGGYYRGGYYRSYNYNQGYYRTGNGAYRGGRGGGRGGIVNVNGMSQRGGTGNSYASTVVRNSTPTK